jgi:hypothetical protein
MKGGHTTGGLPTPDPATEGSIRSKWTAYTRLYRFVGTTYVQAAATRLAEKEPSFNPELRTKHVGGRFDGATRPVSNWLHDPYEYLYGAAFFKGAFYETFGTAIESANGLGVPPELDGSKWLEIFRTAVEVTAVDLRERWEGRSVPILVNTSPDYDACRKWASWIRLNEAAVQALEYEPPHALTSFCVVFFRDHGSAPVARGSCRGVLRVFEAERLSSAKLQGWLRGSGAGNAVVVIS